MKALLIRRLIINIANGSANLKNHKIQIVSYEEILKEDHPYYVDTTLGEVSYFFRGKDLYVHICLFFPNGKDHSFLTTSFKIIKKG